MSAPAPAAGDRLGDLLIKEGLITKDQLEKALQEQKSSGTRLGYKLLGIAVFLIGIMLATNIFGDFMLWLLSPLINAGKGGY